MIDFSTSQLTWVLISSLGLGGTGYVNLYQKVDDLDKKVAVSMNNIEHSIKTVEELKHQLDRIEEKLDSSKKYK
jgi:hypothetical protein|tara:strand:+ start:184 stop:405 length:222 start_codon:yes stop_codon:yes gene_type:complete